MLPLLAATLGQVALGAYQTATSGAGAAEKDFENFAKQNPLAKRSKSLDDYYQQALSRYEENPYQSALYQQAAQNAQRTTAQGINALQDRRSAIGGIGKLSSLQNDALQRAGVQAENYKQQQFSQLGQATQAQTAQDKYLYDVNQATPFNRQLAIKQMKSQAANERYNAGLGMMGSALGNYALGSMFGGNQNVNTPKDYTAANQTNLNQFYKTRESINSNLAPISALRSYMPRLWGQDEPRKSNWYSNTPEYANSIDLTK